MATPLGFASIQLSKKHPDHSLLRQLCPRLHKLGPGKDIPLLFSRENGEVWRMQGLFCCSLEHSRF